jgi:heme exporter protein A
MLEGRHLSSSRGGKPLFTDLSFTLAKGEALVIRGENGSGKSTLLRLIAGLIPQVPDTLYWKGSSIFKQGLHAYQQNIFYAGHKLALFPEARLRDQIKLWQNVSRETIEKSLENWGVAGIGQKKISQLSQGQKKRISLSRCGWIEKSLWILDEPHQGLDIQGKTILQESMNLHLNQGGLVIIATHEETLPYTKEIIL